jgi:hypothetical protein
LQKTFIMYIIQTLFNLIGDVIVSMLASIMVDHGLRGPISQTKIYQIGIACEKNPRFIDFVIFSCFL